MFTMNNRAIFATIKESKRKTNTNKAGKKQTNKQKTKTKAKQNKKKLIIAINRHND